MGDGFENGGNGGLAGGGQAGADAAATAKANEVANTAQAEVLARKKQWDNKQVPDDLFMSDDDLKKPWEDAQGNKIRKPIHIIYFKNPRNGKTSGYIDSTQLDDPDVKKELVAKKLVEYKPEDINQKTPFFNARFEFGGEDNYSAFLQEMNDPTNTDVLKPFSQGSGNENHGIVPKAGVSQENIALAFDLWEARKQVKELQKQEAKIQARADDDGAAIPDVGDQSPSAEMIEAEEKVRILEEKLTQRVKKEKKILAADAVVLLLILKDLTRREQELRNKINSDSSNEIQKDKDDLKKVEELKLTEMMKAIGYSDEDIQEIRGGADSDLPLVLQLARQTSSSKDLHSQEVQDLCAFVKQELTISIQELINKDLKKEKDFTVADVQVMQWVDALKRVMMSFGITDETDQDEKIAELFNTANNLDNSLRLRETDSLDVLLTKLVMGEVKTESVVNDVEDKIAELAAQGDEKKAAMYKKLQQNFDKYRQQIIIFAEKKAGEFTIDGVISFLLTSAEGYMSSLPQYSDVSHDKNAVGKEKISDLFRTPEDVYLSMEEILLKIDPIKYVQILPPNNISRDEFFVINEGSGQPEFSQSKYREWLIKEMKTILKEQTEKALEEFKNQILEKKHVDKNGEDQMILTQEAFEEYFAIAEMGVKAGVSI